MKIALVIVIAILGLIGTIFLALRNEGAVSTSAARPWPGEMGSLKSAEARWPPVHANEASIKLTSLANALPKNDAIDDFIAREITRADLSIGEPPALPDASAIRDLLLREPIIWEREEGIGGGNEMTARRTVQLTVARVLIASALAKARSKDATAWDDLNAVWKLSRTLDAHPQMMAQTAALSMARMINAVAWKMPLPAPAWFGELQSRDFVQPLLESFQFQAASYWQDGARIFPTKWLATSIEHDRKIAEDLFNEKRCDVNTPMNELGTDLGSVWRRAFRYRAEREATANALRIREGKASVLPGPEWTPNASRGSAATANGTRVRERSGNALGAQEGTANLREGKLLVRKGEPIELGSRCTDGSWSFDGSTLRFTRDIPTAPPDTPMPLVLHFKP